MEAKVSVPKQLFADWLSGRAIEDSPFEQDEGRSWCKFDQIVVEPGRAVLRWKQRDVYEISLAGWTGPDVLTLSGIEGRTQVYAL